MALSGVHIACGFIGGSRFYQGESDLVRKPSWSQTMATAGTTSQAAPDNGHRPGMGADLGQPSYEIRSSLDVFVAIGPTPDATSGARLFVAAGETRNVFCDVGDKLAWVAA